MLEQGNRRQPIVLHVLVLSVGSFAVGTGAFVVTGVLPDIARALSLSVANAGLLVTVFAVPFAFGSPFFVSAASGVERRRLLGTALVLQALVFGSAAAALAYAGQHALALMFLAVVGINASLIYAWGQ